MFIDIHSNLTKFKYNSLRQIKKYLLFYHKLLGSRMPHPCIRLEFSESAAKRFVPNLVLIGDFDPPKTLQTRTRTEYCILGGWMDCFAFITRYIG